MLIRENSPMQIFAANCFAEMARMILRNIGRPGMAIHAGLSGGVTGLGDITADNREFALRPTDIRSTFIYPELKVDDIQLSKAAHWLSKGYRTKVGGSPMVGGWCGSPEGTAIGAVATHIAATIMYKIDFIMGGCSHISYHTTTNRASLWASSISHQAIARNSRMIGVGTANRTSGKPSTRQILYEVAAYAIAQIVSGRASLSSPRTATPLYSNHISPLGTRLMVEITPFATSLKRSEANIFVKSLLSKYEDKIEMDKTEPGKPFEQIYDLETLQPRKESLDMYEGVKKDLEALGIEFTK
jgi:methylamine--corrinoid protein Co-methyltransferase